MMSAIFASILVVSTMMIATTSVSAAALVVRSSTTPSCPCANPAHCDPIQTHTDKEVFAFQTNKSNWRFYDWGRLTTIILYDGFDTEMLCFAHSRGVRIVKAAQGVPVAQLQNESFIDAWARDHVQTVVDNFLDGVNVDFENAVSSTADAQGLTQSMIRLSQYLRPAVTGGGQLTFDVAWSPRGIDGRFYDYGALMVICDFVVIMDYDTRSQVFPPSPCVAGPNAPASTVWAGINGYEALMNMSSKIVLGVPWYGYKYECIGVTDPKAKVCPISQSIIYRGCNCTDAAGRQWNFPRMMALSRGDQQNHNTDGLTPSTSLFSNTTGLYATFNAVDNATAKVYQFYFDTPETLRPKYKIAKDRKLRGVSMWNVDSLDYGAKEGSDAQRDTKAMWRALDGFLL